MQIVLGLGFLTRFLDFDTLVLKGDFSNLMGLKSAKITTHWIFLNIVQYRLLR